MDQRNSRPVIGDYSITTQHGIVLLKHIPEHRAAPITFAARRLNGEPDRRTKSGKEAMRQVAIIERALRLRERRRAKLFADTRMKYAGLLD